jgi:hypothetical protein
MQLYLCLQEKSLQRIKEMQAHCKWGLEELQGITSDCPQQQQPEAFEDELRYEKFIFSESSK